MNPNAEEPDNRLLTEITPPPAAKDGDEDSLAAIGQDPCVQDQFRRFADLLPQLIWVALPDGTVEVSNQRWLDFTAEACSRPPQSPQHPWFEAVHPLDRSSCRTHWEEAVTAESVFKMDLRLKRGSDNSYHWHSVEALPGLAQTGNIRRWVGTCCDIENHRQHSGQLERDIDALSRSNGRLRSILESATNVSIIATGADGTITLFNSGAEKLLGYRAADVVAKCTPVAFHRESEILDRAQRLTTESGSPIEGFEVLSHWACQNTSEGQECTYVRNDGTHVTVNLVMKALRDPDGCVDGFLAIAVDITAQKEAEANARAAEEHFRLIVEGAEDYALTMLDAAGHIISWNVGAERIKGYTAAEIIGQHFSLFDTPEGRDRHHPEEELRLAAAHGQYREQGWRVRKDGTRFWAEVVVSAMKDPDGKLKGFAKVVHDITERKRTEERFQLVVEAAPSAMIMVAPDGSIALVNRQTERLFGYQRELLLGQNVEVLLPERFRREHGASIGQYFANSSARPMAAGRDLFGLHKDGKEIPLEIGLTPIETTLGPFILASIVDTSERIEIERKFRDQAAIVDQASDAILVRDSNDRITYWNQGAEKLYGYSKQEALGRVSHELFQTKFPHSIEEIQAQLRSRGDWSGELVHTRPDGSQLTVATTWTIRRGDHARSASVLEINRDLTERKRTENQLRTLSQRLGLATIAMQVGIWDWNIRTNDIEWDDRMRYIYGAPADKQIVYKDWADAVLPEDLPAAEATLQRSILLKTHEPYEFRIQHPDGGIRHLQAAVQTVIDQEGTVIRAVGVNLDVTDRKRAEAVRQEQAVLLSLAKDAIMIRNDDDRITYWNDGARRLYGWTEAEALGQPARSLLKTQLPHPIEEIKEQLLSVGHWSSELTQTDKDGNDVVVASTWTVRGEPGQRMVSILCIDHDITARKRADAALAETRHLLEVRLRDLDRTNRELAAKNEEVEAFVYIVSHDLRGPLLNLQGFCKELEMSCQELREQPGVMADKRMQSILFEDIPVSLRYINTSTSKFNRLINALLELSRTGRHVYHTEEVDLHAIAQTTMDLLRLTIAGVDVEVTLNPLPKVIGDATALGQVFGNLIGNAVKYLQPGRPGKIEIGGERTGSEVHCWVRDNGVGLPSISRDRLFQVFQRFHPNLADGDGIGLAVVRRVVERHGGAVWAESEQGAGTTFHITLPQ